MLVVLATIVVLAISVKNINIVPVEGSSCFPFFRRYWTIVFLQVHIFNPASLPTHFSCIVIVEINSFFYRMFNFPLVVIWLESASEQDGANPTL